MSKLDDAYNRVKAKLENGDHIAVILLPDDVRLLLQAVEDRETFYGALQDLVTDESERRAIGGGPNWRERHAKTWARAMELFGP